MSEIGMARVLGYDARLKMAGIWEVYNPSGTPVGVIQARANESTKSIYAHTYSTTNRRGNGEDGFKYFIDALEWFVRNEAS